MFHFWHADKRDIRLLIRQPHMRGFPLMKDSFFRWTDEVCVSLNALIGRLMGNLSWRIPWGMRSWWRISWYLGRPQLHLVSIESLFLWPTQLLSHMRARWLWQAGWWCSTDGSQDAHVSCLESRSCLWCLYHSLGWRFCLRSRLKRNRLRTICCRNCEFHHESCSWQSNTVACQF